MERGNHWYPPSSYCFASSPQFLDAQQLSQSFRWLERCDKAAAEQAPADDQGAELHDLPPSGSSHVSMAPVSRRFTAQQRVACYSSSVSDAWLHEKGLGCMEGERQGQYCEGTQKGSGLAALHTAQPAQPTDSLECRSDKQQAEDADDAQGTWLLQVWKLIVSRSIADETHLIYACPKLLYPGDDWPPVFSN